MDWEKQLRKYPLVGFIWDMAELYFEKRVSRSAAELAYFLVLSFFPMLICANAAVAMMELDMSRILAVTKEVVPAGVLDIIGDYLGYIGGDRSGLLAVGAAMTLYSSSAAFRALMNITADIYGGKRVAGLRQIGYSVLYSALLLAAVYGSGVVLLTGEWFFRLLDRVLPSPLPETQWLWLRFLILFCLMLALVLIVYRLSAHKDEPRPPIFKGAVLATGALVAASALFSRLIGMSARYSLVYGSLASVIILLVWLYLCGNILILGSVFNCVWYRYQKGERKNERRADPPPEA